MISKRTREFILQRADGLCETCHGPGDFRELSRSHIIAKSRGGKDTQENVLIECYICHGTYEKRPELRPAEQQERVKIAMEQAQSRWRHN